MRLTSYVPGKKFPSISVTGKACALNCAHCGHHYLEGMIPAESPESLKKIIDLLVEKGAEGFLLSGGARSDGSVPIESYGDEVRYAKEKGLKVNVHVGLMQESTMKALKMMRPDMVSLDVVGADETVKEVYHLDKKADDYLNALKWLDKEGIPHSPHITVGLHYGQVIGEFKAIDAVKRSAAKKMVINVLIPTKGTEMQDIRPPSVDEIKKVLEHTEGFHGERVIGCMRPRTGNYWGVERYAIENGFSGIVIPTERTRKWAEKEGYEWENRYMCCVF